MSHPIDVESGTDTDRESLEIREPILLKWRSVAKSNKRLHEAARAYYKGLADSSMLSAVVLGSMGGALNIVLGLIEPDFHVAINIGQVVLGVSGLVSAGIVSTAKQLGWESKHQLHEEYTARYSEVVRMINTEEALMRLHDSSFASMADFIKTVQNELNRIEDHAPPIPGFLETKLGIKSSHTNGD